jgi:hypothetical protein
VRGEGGVPVFVGGFHPAAAGVAVLVEPLVQLVELVAGEVVEADPVGHGALLLGSSGRSMPATMSSKRRRVWSMNAWCAASMAAWSCAGVAPMMTTRLRAVRCGGRPTESAGGFFSGGSGSELLHFGGRGLAENDGLPLAPERGKVAVDVVGVEVGVRRRFEGAVVPVHSVADDGGPAGGDLGGEDRPRRGGVVGVRGLEGEVVRDFGEDAGPYDDLGAAFGGVFAADAGAGEGDLRDELRDLFGLHQALPFFCRSSSAMAAMSSRYSVVLLGAPTGRGPV